MLKGHLSEVQRVAWSADQCRAFSGDTKGGIRVWNLTGSQPTQTPRLIVGVGGTNAKVGQTLKAFVSAPDQVQYTNAKVLLVGDSGVGKSGLSNYLAHGIKVEDGKPIPSSDGAWATHWPLSQPKKKDGVDREIWRISRAGGLPPRPSALHG